jgi:hypothetical protein
MKVMVFNINMKNVRRTTFIYIQLYIYIYFEKNVNKYIYSNKI